MGGQVILKTEKNATPQTARDKSEKEGANVTKHDDAHSERYGRAFRFKVAMDCN